MSVLVCMCVQKLITIDNLWADQLRASKTSYNLIIKIDPVPKNRIPWAFALPPPFSAALCVCVIVCVCA